MKQSLHEEIYDKLNNIEDINMIQKEKNLPIDLLHVIYTQKITRNATKRYYKIKNQSKELLNSWTHGETLFKIAKRLDFPPILLTQIILQEYGLSRKETRTYINEPDNIIDERIKREIHSVRKRDFAYSPKAHEKQLKRGIDAEEKLKDWLVKRNINFQREKELRNKFRKTPDFLLEEPIKIEGSKIYWIESKASFGDDKEILKDIKKQLTAYKEMFGSGMVVYWYGFLDKLESDGFIIKSREFFKD